MEGNGEGMVAVVQGLRDAGLAVTVMKHSSCRNVANILAVKNQILPQIRSLVDSSTQNNEVTPFKSHAGVQICDDRYASSYKLAHCSVNPSSPPVSLSEFPPQRAQPCRTQGNFKIGGCGSGEVASGPIKAQYSFRSSLRWTDGGSLQYSRASCQTDPFAFSLRRYPSILPSRSISADLIERLIKHTQAKNFSKPSKISKSMRSIPKDDETGRPKDRRSKNIQTYTRTRREDLNDIGDGEKPFERKERSFRMSYSSNRKLRKSKDSYPSATYDYLKRGSALYRRRYDVQYLDGLAKYLRDTLQQICDDRSVVCPRIQSRYNQHRLNYHDQSNHDDTDDQVATPGFSRVSSTSTDSRRGICRKDCPKGRKLCDYCNKPLACPCVAKTHLTKASTSSPIVPMTSKFCQCQVKDVDKKRRITIANQELCLCKKDEETAKSAETEAKIVAAPVTKIPEEVKDYSSKFNDEVTSWVNELPVYSNDNPKNVAERLRLGKELADVLKDFPKDKSYDDNVIDEAKRYLGRLPIWMPESQPDRDAFKQQMAKNLWDRLKKIADRHDQLTEIIKKWVDDIHFLQDVDRKQVIEEFVLKLKPIAINRPDNNYEYAKQLKGAIIEKLQAFPVAIKCDKNAELNQLADKLVDKLVSLPRGAIGSEGKESSDEVLQKIKNWISNEKKFIHYPNLKDGKDVLDLSKNLTALLSKDVNDDVVNNMRIAIQRFLKDIVGFKDVIVIVKLTHCLLKELVGDKFKVSPNTRAEEVDLIYQHIYNWVKDLPETEHLDPDKVEELCRALTNEVYDSILAGGADININEWSKNVLNDLVEKEKIEKEKQKARKLVLIEIDDFLDKAVTDLPSETKEELKQKLADMLIQNIDEILTHEVEEDLLQDETDRMVDKLFESVKRIFLPDDKLQLPVATKKTMNEEVDNLLDKVDFKDKDELKTNIINKVVDGMKQNRDNDELEKQILKILLEANLPKELSKSIAMKITDKANEMALGLKSEDSELTNRVRLSKAEPPRFKDSIDIRNKEFFVPDEILKLEYTRKKSSLSPSEVKRFKTPEKVLHLSDSEPSISDHVGGRQADNVIKSVEERKKDDSKINKHQKREKLLPEHFKEQLKIYNIDESDEEAVAHFKETLEQAKQEKRPLDKLLASIERYSNLPRVPRKSVQEKKVSTPEYQSSPSTSYNIAVKQEYIEPLDKGSEIVRNKDTSKIDKAKDKIKQDDAVVSQREIKREKVNEETFVREKRDRKEDDIARSDQTRSREPIYTKYAISRYKSSIDDYEYRLSNLDDKARFQDKDFTNINKISGLNGAIMQDRNKVETPYTKANQDRIIREDGNKDYSKEKEGYKSGEDSTLIRDEGKDVRDKSLEIPAYSKTKYITDREMPKRKHKISDQFPIERRRKSELREKDPRISTKAHLDSITKENAKKCLSDDIHRLLNKVKSKIDNREDLVIPLMNTLLDKVDGGDLSETGDELYQMLQDANIRQDEAMDITEKLLRKATEIFNEAPPKVSEPKRRRYDENRTEATQRSSAREIKKTGKRRPEDSISRREKTSSTVRPASRKGDSDINAESRDEFANTTRVRTNEDLTRPGKAYAQKHRPAEYNKQHEDKYMQSREETREEAELKESILNDIDTVFDNAPVALSTHTKEALKKKLSDAFIEGMKPPYNKEEVKNKLLNILSEEPVRVVTGKRYGERGKDTTTRRKSTDSAGDMHNRIQREISKILDDSPTRIPKSKKNHLKKKITDIILKNTIANNSDVINRITEVLTRETHLHKGVINDLSFDIIERIINIVKDKTKIKRQVYTLQMSGKKRMSFNKDPRYYDDTLVDVKRSKRKDGGSYEDIDGPINKTKSAVSDPRIVQDVTEHVDSIAREQMKIPKYKIEQIKNLIENLSHKDIKAMIRGDSNTRRKVLDMLTNDIKLNEGDANGIINGVINRFNDDQTSATPSQVQEVKGYLKEEIVALLNKFNVKFSKEGSIQSGSRSPSYGEPPFSSTPYDGVAPQLDTSFSTVYDEEDETDIINNSEEYFKRVKVVINDWVEELPLDLRDSKTRNVMVEDLAGDILERQKYLQLNPRAKPSKKEEMECLKYQVFRWMNNVTDVGDLTPLVPKIEDLKDRLDDIGIPELTVSSKKRGSVGARRGRERPSDAFIDKFEDWVGTLPMKFKNDEDKKQFESLKSDLLTKLKELGPDASPQAIEREINKFLRKAPLVPSKKIDQNEKIDDLTRIVQTTDLSNMNPASFTSGADGKEPPNEFTDKFDAWVDSLPIKFKEDKEAKEFYNLKSELFSKLKELGPDASAREIRNEINKFLRKAPLDPSKKVNVDDKIDDLIRIIQNTDPSTMEAARLDSKTGRRKSSEAFVDKFKNWFGSLPVKLRNNDEKRQFENLKQNLYSKLKELGPNASIHAIKNEINKFVKKMPIDPDRRVNLDYKIEELAKLLKTTDPSKMEKVSFESKSGKKVPNLLYDFIEKWCEVLPFDDSLDPETVKSIKHSLANKILQKICQLNLNPEILNDDFLYEDVLRDELENLLNDHRGYIPIDDEQLTEFKDILVTEIKEAKQRTQNELAGQMYKQQLRDAVSRTLPQGLDLTSEDLTSLEVLKDAVADAFINLNYSFSNDELKNKMRKKIADEVTRFCNSYLSRHPATPICSNKINQDLYAALKSVTLPSDESMKSEVEHARIKDVITDWVRTLPIAEQSPAGQLTLNKMVSILAKRLHDLETAGHVDGSDYSDDIKKETNKWLQKLPILGGKDAVDIFAADLLERLKNTEDNRRFDTSGTCKLDAKEVCPGPCHFVIREKPTPKPCPDTCMVSNYPTCSLNREDREHLDRIRERVQARTKAGSRRDASASPCIDTGSQTNVRALGSLKSVSSVCPTAFQKPCRSTSRLRESPSCKIPFTPYIEKPVCPWMYGASGPGRGRGRGASPCANSYNGSHAEVQPQVIVKEYVWNSTCNSNQHIPCDYYDEGTRPQQPPVCPGQFSHSPQQRYSMPQSPNMSGSEQESRRRPEPCSSRYYREKVTRLGSLDDVRCPNVKSKPSDNFEWGSARFTDEDDFWATCERPMILSDEDFGPFSRERERREERVRCRCRERVVTKSAPKKRNRYCGSSSHSCNEQSKNCSRCTAVRCPHPSYLYFRK